MFLRGCVPAGEVKREICNERSQLDDQHITADSIMGLFISFQPTLGLGFAIHFLVPAIELCVGPLIIIFGDLDQLSDLDD